MTRDELLSGPDRERRRWPLVVGVLVAVLLVIGARWQEDRRIDQLLASAQRAEEVVATSRSSRSGLLGYSAALLARDDVPPAARRGVLTGVVRDTERYTSRVADRRAEVAAVEPLPWERRALRLQEAYLARLDAWTSFVEAARADPEAVVQEDRRTRTARERAADAVRAAASSARADRLAAALSR